MPDADCERHDMPRGRWAGGDREDMIEVVKVLAVRWQLSRLANQLSIGEKLVARDEPGNAECKWLRVLREAHLEPVPCEAGVALIALLTPWRIGSEQRPS